MHNAIDYPHFILRIILAVIFGGLIGIEREKHGRAAGFRTNILVCVSATLVMMCSQQIYAVAISLYGPFDANSAARVDPGRIANGIIMGIGFLGAGAIVRHDTITRGLTTAACLWLVTGVGIALGLGLYSWAFSATVLALIVLLPMKRLERLFDIDRYGALSVTGDAKTLTFDALDGILKSSLLYLQTYDVKMDNTSGEKSFQLNVKFANRVEPEEIVQKVSALPGVRSVEWR